MKKLLSLFISFTVLFGYNLKAAPSTKSFEKHIELYKKKPSEKLQQQIIIDYKKIFSQDSLKLVKLLNESTPVAWQAYKNTISEIKNRQSQLLKLGINYDNYDYDESLIKAQEYIAKRNMLEGKYLLDKAETTQNREIANQAKEKLFFAYRLGMNDQDLITQLNKAKLMAKTHVLIQLTNTSNVEIPEAFKQKILNRYKEGNYADMVVATTVQPGEFYDFILSIDIDSIYIDFYQSSYFGNNYMFNIYKQNFNQLTSKYKFSYSKKYNNPVFFTNVTSNQNFYLFTPYERTLYKRSVKFLGYKIPPFTTFNITGSYKLINVRAKQIVKTEPMHFFREVDAYSLVPLLPGTEREKELYKFTSGFYNLSQLSAYFTNPLFEKNITKTIDYEFSNFIVDNRHVLEKRFVVAEAY